MNFSDNYEPKEVLDYFKQLCSIPHGSGNCKAIANWLVSFATSHNLKHYRDEADNVIIIKDASRGYENAAPVILQAHIDMVCEKAAGVSIDFENDPIKLIMNDDIVSADGTTLGADNGIGVALILAILSSSAICHPQIEAVFTADEEIGMIGAAAIDVSPLKSTRMINIDSEEEGIFTVGCAGGNVTKNSLHFDTSEFSGEGFIIKISSLTGGHSGIDIDKGRANSNILMGRMLLALFQNTDMRLVSVNGGNKDNAIACDTEAVIIVDDIDTFNEIFENMKSAFLSEYRITEPVMSVSFEPTQMSVAMDKDSTQKVLTLLSLSPDGVQSMSMDIEGLVQTSLNLGILKTQTDCVEMSYCVRSSSESQKAMICDKLRALCALVGGTTEISGDYPAWEYRANSPLRDLMIDVYEKQYGNRPELVTIHAGLECGMFTSKIQDLDCVSFGPQLHDIHTCREHFSVCSVNRIWKMLVEILNKMQ